MLAPLPCCLPPCRPAAPSRSLPTPAVMAPSHRLCWAVACVALALCLGQATAYLNDGSKWPYYDKCDRDWGDSIFYSKGWESTPVKGGVEVRDETVMFCCKRSLCVPCMMLHTMFMQASSAIHCTHPRSFCACVPSCTRYRVLSAQHVAAIMMANTV